MPHIEPRDRFAASDKGNSGFLRQIQSFYSAAENVQGGFYFHPSDEDPLLGTPERKKPLSRISSPYSNSEFALAGK